MHDDHEVEQIAPKVAIDSFIDRNFAWLKSTRTIMIVMGAACAWLSVTTMTAYTDDELALRDMCSIALLAAGIIGLGTIFVKPNRTTMGSMGILIILNSILRFIGFGVPVWRNEVDHETWIGNRLWQFFQEANVVPVWGLVGFLGGVVLFMRRNDPPVTGARDAP